MNLLDLLSDDNPADTGTGQVDMQHYLDNVGSEFRPEHSQTYQNQPEQQISGLSGPTADNVIYLPSMMSNLQKDVCELIVQIFRKGLEQELQRSKNRASISNLSNGDDDLPGGMGAGDVRESRARLINLMFEQLRKVSMHPSLLVDHFIPKRWLLLEVNERLLNLSGKLALFDRIIELLCDSYGEDDKPKNDFNVLVMAETVKELEWIEGTIIGKKINYKNLNTRKLYDMDEASRDTGDEFTEDELFAADNRNKRKYYSRRRKVMAEKSRRPGVVLHLATSRHMYESYASSVQFDLIFSFDSHPDLQSASMQLIRGNNQALSVSLQARQYKTPIIIPIPIYSVEYFSLVLPRPELEFDLTSGPDPQINWKLKVISAFVANRHRLYERDDRDFYVEHFGDNYVDLRGWLMRWWEVPPPASASLLENSKASLLLHPSEEKLLKRLLENFTDHLKAVFSLEKHKFKFENPSTESVEEIITDFDTFKKKFAEALNYRTELVETTVRRGLHEVLPEYKKAETERQTDIDACEDQMGERYRKLRKLNEEASIVDRKHNRAEAEHSKTEATHTETKEMLKHLEDVLREKSDEDIKKLVEEQSKIISQLGDEKERLDKELEKAVEEGESLRGEYQTKSSEAVNSSLSLSTAQAKKDTLNGTLNGPGMHILPSLRRQYEQISYDTKYNRLHKENAFLKLLFLSYLDKMVKERRAVVDSTAAGLSSRPTNRMSRGLTPFT